MGAEPEARLGSMVRETPAILAAAMMESGGLSRANASAASILSLGWNPESRRNLPIEEELCQLLCIASPFCELHHQRTHEPRGGRVNGLEAEFSTGRILTQLQAYVVVHLVVRLASLPVNAKLIGG